MTNDTSLTGDDFLLRQLRSQATHPQQKIVKKKQLCLRAVALTPAGAGENLWLLLDHVKERYLAMFLCVILGAN